jgi:hypothetical protein
MKLVGFIGSSAFAGGGALSFLTIIAQAGHVVGHAAHQLPSSTIAMIVRVLGSGVATKIATGYWGDVVAMYNHRTQAHGILAKTLDAPEARFFQLTRGNRPRRVTMNVIGPFGAAVLIVLGAVVVWFLINILAAYF